MAINKYRTTTIIQLEHFLKPIYWLGKSRIKTFMAAVHWRPLLSSLVQNNLVIEPRFEVETFLDEAVKKPDPNCQLEATQE